MKSDLIYDVGANNGDDTAYYLARGYRVLSVEANPLLAERLRQRFAREIEAGRVIVEGRGVSDRAGEFPFWVNEVSDEFSSFVQEVGCREGQPCHPVQVQAVPFADIL